MSNLNEGYLYKVIVSHTVEGADLDSFVEEYKFKKDKYVISIEKVERPISCTCSIKKDELTVANGCGCCE